MKINIEKISIENRQLYSDVFDIIICFAASATAYYVKDIHSINLFILSGITYFMLGVVFMMVAKKGMSAGNFIFKILLINNKTRKKTYFYFILRILFISLMICSWQSIFNGNNILVFMALVGLIPFKMNRPVKTINSPLNYLLNVSYINFENTSESGQTSVK